MLLALGSLGLLIDLILVVSLTMAIFINAANENRHPGGVIGPFGAFIIVIITFGILISMAVPFTGNGIHKQIEGGSAAAAHNLAIAAFSYSNDNNQIYPSGSTSTEIFQTLYDGKYLIQPGNVLLKLREQSLPPGKVLYSGNLPIHLKSENVSWDFVTQGNSGVTGWDPTDLPLVFSQVTTAPNWQAGVNNAVITSSDTWGTEGVTVCTLAQQAWFARPSPSQVEVPLTDSEFQPAPGVKYVTRKP